MNISHALSPLLAVISGGLLSGTALSDNIVLPPPDKKGGRPLMQVLNERHSTRQAHSDGNPVFPALGGSRRQPGRS